MATAHSKSVRAARKKKATQEELENVRLGKEDLPSTFQFKYLGVIQTRDGDPLGPVNYRIANAWSRFQDIRSVLTDAKFPIRLRLRLLRVFCDSILLYGCESWKLTDKVQ